MKTIVVDFATVAAFMKRSDEQPLCALCRKPTVPGVNSDFCSATCEDTWEAAQRGEVPLPERADG